MFTAWQFDSVFLVTWSGLGDLQAPHQQAHRRRSVLRRLEIPKRLSRAIGANSGRSLKIWVMPAV
jgi:hypothetical protein